MQGRDRQVSNTYTADAGEGCLLFSATVFAIGPSGKKVLVRALIDPGSTEDFVAQRLGQHLGLESIGVKSLTIQPFMTSPINIDAREVKLRLQSMFDENCYVDMCPIEIESTACKLSVLPKQSVLDTCRKRR